MYSSLVRMFFIAFVFHFISLRFLLLITFNFIPFWYLYNEGQGIFLEFKCFAIPVNPKPFKYNLYIFFTIPAASASITNLLLFSFYFS